MNLEILHPDCRAPWERGMTNYPLEEHIRDCDKCLEHNTRRDKVQCLEVARNLRLCGGAIRYEKEIQDLTQLLKDVRKDLEDRARDNDWARTEDPELFFSTLGHAEDDGVVVALGSTMYWRLCKATRT